MRTLRSLVCFFLSASLAQNPHAPARSARSDGATFSINSPRRSGGVGVVSAATTGRPQEVLVRLPDDLKQTLYQQRSDRSRIHASILGLEPDTAGDHLDRILGNDERTTTTSRTTTTASTSIRPTTAFAPSPSITTITTAVTVKTDTDYRALPVPPDREEVPSRSFWSIAWEAHVYFSGTLFALLAAYCTVNILRLHTFSRLFSRGYFVALNLCLVAVGVLRPIFLFHDPYNESGLWHRAAAYILLDSPFPCITTAFAVLFLALLRATQIELVSPGFQTPKALGCFCLLHLLISVSVDLLIGWLPQLRYTILICQGFFIVWSLLLSAGYFYIFSAMKKVAMRSHVDVMRYPKLVLDNHHQMTMEGHPGSLGSSHHQRVGVNPEGLQSNGSRPPLARAVHLTLGVAVLGSLMGGVQLFGMIKMLGLQRADMSSRHNEMAWYGYQVSMRILEVTICALLAVIATTPLRSDPGNSQSGSRCCFRCCCGEENPPRELEDEIYSEICSNNHSVRQIGAAAVGGGGGGGGGGQPPIMQPPLVTAENPYGTLGGRMALEQQQVMVPMANMGDANAVMLSLSSSGKGTAAGTRTSLASSSSNPNSTLRSTTVPQDPNNRTSVASSRATLDTNLYTNLRSTGSRPSSMLFNDSGFIRFRTGNDQQNSPSDEPQTSIALREKDGMRASQSFDQAVLLTEQQQQHLELNSPNSYCSSSRNPMDVDERTNSPIYKSIDGSEGETSNKASKVDPQNKASAYEPPPGMRLPVQPGGNPIYSESDLESVDPLYPKGPPRAPSRCSSVSATQSFDMRMYGKTLNEVSAAATTMKRNEAAKEKLENPYYYYGSTRNQKKYKQLQQKPRPLLPSQRQQLETEARLFVASKGVERPRQQQQQVPFNQQQRQDHFQRSRSLGGYYNRGGGGSEVVEQVVAPPTRNQMPRFDQFYQQHHQPAAGSMTPVSYSRWQHSEQGARGFSGDATAARRRRNPLYDTPPTARHAQQQIQDVQSQLLFFQQQQPQFRGFRPEVRGVLGTPPIRRQMAPQWRSQPPQQSHPGYLASMVQPGIVHGGRLLNRRPSGYRSDPSEYDDDDEDSSTAAALGHPDDCLADNESEASSVAAWGDGRARKGSDQPLSPLEYSAMLKLHRQEREDQQMLSGRQQQMSFKDITPDSGVVMENEAKKSSNTSKHNESSSSSLNDLLGSSGRGVRGGATTNKDYSRVCSNEAEGDFDDSSRRHNTVFSSSSSSTSSSEEDEGRKHNSHGKRYQPLSTENDSLTKESFRSGKMNKNSSSPSSSSEASGTEEPVKA